jgi:pimeloyl-ACP methyl ester carboxylesterase
MTDVSMGSEGSAEREEHWIRGPAGRLHVIDLGREEAEAVVFVHSFAGDASHWSAQLVHLRRRGRRAIAIDLRGHGASDAPKDGEYTVAALGRDVAAVANELGLRRFVLVGHSLGAAVAGDFAGRHPERVAALVLVDPAGDNPRLPSEKTEPYRKSLYTDRYRLTIEQYLSDVLLANARPQVRTRVRAGLTRASHALAVRATEAGVDYSLLPALAAYRHAGGRALTITSDQNEGPLTLHTLLPDLPRRHIAGTSHYVALDDPDAFNRVLDELLASAA